jgi:hypothetical protein
LCNAVIDRKRTTLISLLSPWTHNCPFSRFSWLLNDICNTAGPHSYFMPTPGTATHIMSHHLMFGITCCNTSRVSPSCWLSARQSRIIFQATHYYIWHSRFNSRVARTWRALLGDILLILWTFPISLPRFYDFTQPILRIPLFLTCDRPAALSLLILYFSL